jgi:hypothetical protein
MLSDGQPKCRGEAMIERLLNDIQARMNKPRGPDPTLLVVAVALVSAVITFLATWYLDPRLGRRRRTMTLDRFTASARRLTRRSDQHEEDQLLHIDPPFVDVRVPDSSAPMARAAGGS